MEQRPNSRKRGYDSRWDKAAATFKATHPLCLGCQAIGKTVRTEVVDHVEPHKGNQGKFWNTALWQPACRWHHDVIKPQLERRYLAGECTLDQLWLNSPMAIQLSKRSHPPLIIDASGWGVGG